MDERKIDNKGFIITFVHFVMMTIRQIEMLIYMHFFEHISTFI
jgi:hypothetical protein